MVSLTDATPAHVFAVGQATAILCDDDETVLPGVPCFVWEYRDARDTSVNVKNIHPTKLHDGVKKSVFKPLMR